LVSVLSAIDPAVINSVCPEIDRARLRIPSRPLNEAMNEVIVVVLV
jgi:hypothetical protein